MGLLGTGPDLMAEIGLDSRSFLLGTRQVGTSLNVLAAHPIFTATAIGGAIGGIAVHQAMKFEDAMVGVAATLDITNEEAEDLAETFRLMSRERPFSAAEIARVAKLGAQFGIAEVNLAKFTATVLDVGSIAEDLDVDEAATAMAQFANASQMGEEDFDRLGSTLRLLAKNTATSEGQIIKMGLRMAGMAAVAGLSHAETLGLAAALSSLGIRAEMGGSAASRALAAIDSSVKDTSAEGQKKLRAFANVAGMSATDFAMAWQAAPADAFLSFISGLSDMDEAQMNTIGVLRDLGLNEIRVRDTLLRSVNGLDLLHKAQDLAAKGWSEQDTHARDARRVYATTSGQLKLLGNDIVDLAIGIGNRLLPGVRRLVHAFRDLFAGDYAGFASKLLSVFEDAINGVVNFIRTTDWASVGLAVATALGMAIVGIASWFVETFRNIEWDSVGERVGEVFQAAIMGLVSMLHTLDWGELGRTVARVLTEAFDALIAFVLSVDWGQVMYGLARWVTEDLVSFFGTALLALAGRAVTFFSSGEFLAVGAAIVAGLWGGINGAADGLIAHITSFAKRIIDAFKEMLGIASPSKVFEEIGGYIIEGLKQGITNAWDAFSGWFMSKLTGLVDGALSIFGIASPSSIFAGIGENIVAGFQQGVAPLGDLLDGGNTLRANIQMSDVRAGAAGGAAAFGGAGGAPSGGGQTIVYHIDNVNLNGTAVKDAPSFMRGLEFESQYGALSKKRLAL